MNESQRIKSWTKIAHESFQQYTFPDFDPKHLLECLVVTILPHEKKKKCSIKNTIKSYENKKQLFNKN